MNLTARLNTLEQAHRSDSAVDGHGEVRFEPGAVEQLSAQGRVEIADHFAHGGASGFNRLLAVGEGSQRMRNEYSRHN